MPFWTSYLLRVFAWKVILGFNGVINSGLISASAVINEPLEFLLYNPTAVIITLAHAWAGVCHPADLCLAREDRPLAARGGDRSRRRARSSASCASPCRCRCPAIIAASLARLHPDGRRLCHAHAGRRHRRHDDRQHHPVAVRQGQQLAAGRGALDRHDAGRDRRSSASSLWRVGYRQDEGRGSPD